MKNQRLKHTFDHDYEMWCAYDYAACLATTHDVYRPATWESRGGVHDSGYIWVDDARWSMDTPENPHSILALMTWRQWYFRDAVELREATLSVHLRGDKLDLKGGRCLFWVLSRRFSTRWHFVGQPLHVESNRWAETPNVVTLKNDESLWHRSWTVPGMRVPRLDEVLGAVESYGFSLVGFRGNVTGRFSMDEFELKLAHA